MNFWQWEIIAGKLKEHGLEFKTHSTLAYLPSITAWSRQAIFKGDKPDLTKDNSKESDYFLQYWKSPAEGRPPLGCCFGFSQQGKG